MEFKFKSIYLSKDESTFVCVCVRSVWKGQAAPSGLKIWKNIQKTRSWIMKGRFSHPPDREHDNPLKPVGTRDDVGKNLVNAIVARFRRIFPTLRGRFPSIRSIFPANPQIWRHGQNISNVTRIWKGESAPWELKIWKKISKRSGIVNNGRPLFGPTRSGARQPA